MKFAVPSMGETLKSYVSDSLGHSPFIMIYDDRESTFDFISNSGFKIREGSGLKATDILTKKKVDVLLTREIGRKAYSVLMKKHIKVHLLSSQISVKTAINKFTKT